MPYLVPPAGFPISTADIFKMLGSRFKPEANSSIFINQIKTLTGAKHCFLFNLGRTALYHALDGMMKLSDSSRDEVIIPAYTCFTVAAPVAKLGLKIRLVDIDPSTMDFDYGQLLKLNFDKVLAIVPSNLFGIVSNWDNLLPIRRDHNVFIIDDSAQAMGSRFGNRPAGSFGDAGIFSLDRGKPLSTYLGGILITNKDELAVIVEKTAKKMRQYSTAHELSALLKIIAYALMLHPRLYWLPNKMPFLNLGQTVFEPNFEIGGLSRLQKCAGAAMFHKLNHFNAIRSQNAKMIGERLSCDDRYKIPGYSENNNTIYVRLPVMARNRNERDKAIFRLSKYGIKASAMYPSTISQIPGIGRYLANQEFDFNGAQTVVDRLFTLPTHPYLTNRDVDKILECLTGK